MLRARVVSQPASDSYRNLKTYLRAQLGYAGWEGGFVLEKDRYESRFNDFQSFYLEKVFARKGLGHGRVVAGDFLLSSGHGLVFSNPYGYSPSTVDPWRFSQGDFAIRPYTSVEENFGLAGAGLGLSRGRMDLCIAASRTKYDASLDEDGRVKALGTSGLHVSGHEREGRQTLEEDLIGLALRWTSRVEDADLSHSGGAKVFSAKGVKRSAGGAATRSAGGTAKGSGHWGAVWRIGFDASYSRINREFSVERLSWLSTDGILMGSLDLSLELRETVAFAQGAVADGGGGSLIAGLAFDRGKTDFLMVGRTYDDTYLSLHSRPFAFYSGIATGERGILARIGFEPLSRMVLSIGSDLHQKRMPEDGLSRPSGSESFLNLTYKVGKATLSIGEKLLVSHEPPEGEGGSTEERSRLRSRVDAGYRARSWLSLRLRYENLRSSEDEGEGIQSSSSDLLRLDADFRKLRPLEIRAGFYVFTIGEWASRIYQYEPGVPYYPVIEMLKSDGSRWYLVLSLGMERFGRLSAKYGRTEYAGGEDRSGFLFYYSLRT
jgi:hypothetical protein